MGNGPTLAHRLDDAEAATLAARTAEAADATFRWANRDRAAIANHPDPLARQELVRGVEDLDVRGYRAWNEETLEDWPTAADVRVRVPRERAAATQLFPSTADLAFDRLNPDFGVPVDQQDRYGQQDVRDREAALALGTRVAVANSRENDRDPGMWIVGQDYRAADAVQAARRQPTRTRGGPER